MSNIREGLNPESLIKKYDLKAIMVSGSTLSVMGKRELPQRAITQSSENQIVSEIYSEPSFDIPQIVQPAFNIPTLKSEPAVSVTPTTAIEEPAVNGIPYISSNVANKTTDVDGKPEEDAVITSINRKLVDGPSIVKQDPIESTLQTPQEFNNGIAAKENKGVIVDFVAYLVQAQRNRISKIEEMQKEIDKQIEAHKKEVDKQIEAHKKEVEEEYKGFIRKAESIAEGNGLAPIVNLESVREALEKQNQTLGTQSYEEKYGKVQGF